MPGFESQILRASRFFPPMRRAATAAPGFKVTAAVGCGWGELEMAKQLSGDDTPAVLKLPNGVSLQKLTSSHVPDVSRLIAEAFVNREPLCVYTGVELATMERFLEIFATDAAEKGLSFVATKEGTMVGGLICKDFAAPFPELPDDVVEKLSHIFALLGETDDGAVPANARKPGELVNYTVIGVDPNHLKEKVGDALVYTAVANAILMRYIWGSAEATTPYSRQLLVNMGYEQVHVVDYEGFKLPDGSNPFAGINGMFAKKFGVKPDSDFKGSSFMERELAYGSELQKFAGLAKAFHTFQDAGLVPVIGARTELVHPAELDALEQAWRILDAAGLLPPGANFFDSAIPKL